MSTGQLLVITAVFSLFKAQKMPTYINSYPARVNQMDHFHENEVIIYRKNPKDHIWLDNYYWPSQNLSTYHSQKSRPSPTPLMANESVKLRHVREVERNSTLKINQNETSVRKRKSSCLNSSNILDRFRRVNNKDSQNNFQTHGVILRKPIFPDLNILRSFLLSKMGVYYPVEFPHHRRCTTPPVYCLYHRSKNHLKDFLLFHTPFRLHVGKAKPQRTARNIIYQHNMLYTGIHSSTKMMKTLTCIALEGCLTSTLNCLTTPQMKTTTICPTTCPTTANPTTTCPTTASPTTRCPTTTCPTTCPTTACLTTTCPTTTCPTTCPTTACLTTTCPTTVCPTTTCPTTVCPTTTCPTTVCPTTTCPTTMPFTTTCPTTCPITTCSTTTCPTTTCPTTCPTTACLTTTFPNQTTCLTTCPTTTCPITTCLKTTCSHTKCPTTCPSTICPTTISPKTTCLSITCLKTTCSAIPYKPTKKPVFALLNQFTRLFNNFLPTPVTKFPTVIQTIMADCERESDWMTNMKWLNAFLDESRDNIKPICPKNSSAKIKASKFLNLIVTALLIVYFEKITIVR